MNLDQIIKSLSEKGVETYYTKLYKVLRKHKLINVKKKTFINYILNYYTLRRNYYLKTKNGKGRFYNDKELEEVIKLLKETSGSNEKL